jgi:hypothetical protein
MDYEDFAHQIIYINGQWAVKPTDGDIVAQFATQAEAIEVGYKLALEAGDELMVFDENGALVKTIDPEDDLELSDKMKDILDRFLAGKMTFVSRDKQPSKDLPSDG